MSATLRCDVCHEPATLAEMVRWRLSDRVRQQAHRQCFAAESPRRREAE